MTVIMLALLLLCRDALLVPSLVGFYKAQFLFLGLIALLGLGFLVANRHRLTEILRDPRLLLVAASAVICLLPMLVKRDWQLMYCSVLLCLLLGIFFSFFTEVRELAKTYVLVVTVLGVYSLLAAYVLRLGVDRGLWEMPVFYNSVGVEFYNFFLSCVPESYVKGRNFGIFREPGVYQFFLLLALYLNNDWLCWDRAWKQWCINGLLAVTMVSTFATGGVIEMGLLAVLLFFDKKWYRERKLRLAALGVIGLGIALAAVCIVKKNDLYWSVYDMFYGKFLGDNESGPDRIASIVETGKLFFTSPLVGWDLWSVLHVSLNVTSSTMILFSGFGILGGVFHVLPWLALVWKKERKFWVNGAYLVILLMSFNTQNLIADIFLWLFPMMALTDRVVPRLADRRKAETENGNGN